MSAFPGQPQATHRGLVLLAEDLEWQELARCREVDAEIFWPATGENTIPAKKVCFGCEVRRDCLDHAMRHNEPGGIWGGMTANERKELRRRRRRDI